MKSDHPNKGKAICLDFDGVIHKYSEGFKHEIYDEPVEGSFKAIRELIDRGFKVIVQTAFPHIEQLKPWFTKYGLEDKYLDKIEILGGKPPAMLYVDDRGVRFTNWKDIMNYVR